MAGGLEVEVETIAPVAVTRTVRSSDEAEGPRARVGKQAREANVVLGLGVPKEVTQHQVQVKAQRRMKQDGGGIRLCCEGMSAGLRDPAQLGGLGRQQQGGACVRMRCVCACLNSGGAGCWRKCSLPVVVFFFG